MIREKDMIKGKMQEGRKERIDQTEMEQKKDFLFMVLSNNDKKELLLIQLICIKSKPLI